MMENNSELTTEQSMNPEMTQISGLLVGGGALGSLYLLVKKNQSIFSWIHTGGHDGGRDRSIDEGAYQANPIDRRPDHRPVRRT